MPREQPVILDGHPRTVAQAESLRRLLAESGRQSRRPLLLRLDASPAAVLKRLRSRRDVEGRSDDRDDAIRRRLQIYDAEVTQVVDSLSRWGDVAAIDGAPPVDAVAGEVLERLEARSGCRLPESGDGG